jgi:16S rRNA (guanine966-N2)-methyltransferase
MRVIAGRFRGRRLLAPAGRTTRPILDRVKVALFDWLCSRLAEPGALPPLAVLDLFCGGGSLGIEALSRGAGYCAFVEVSEPAATALRENLQMLGIGPEATVAVGPAERVPIRSPDGGFGLVFFDPPYPATADHRAGGILDRVLRRLGADLPLAAGALLVWRHASTAELPAEAAPGWRCVQRRTWGGMAVTLFERRSEGKT